MSNKQLIQSLPKQAASARPALVSLSLYWVRPTALFDLNCLDSGTSQPITLTNFCFTAFSNTTTDFASNIGYNANRNHRCNLPHHLPGFHHQHSSLTLPSSMTPNPRPVVPNEMGKQAVYISIFRGVVFREIEVSINAKVEEQFDARFRARFKERLGEAFEPKFKPMAQLVRGNVVEELGNKLSQTVAGIVFHSVFREVLDETGAVMRRLHAPNTWVRDAMYDLVFHEKYDEVMDEQFDDELEATFDPAFDEAFPEVFDQKFDELLAVVTKADSPKAA
ncbi:hypothetical protein CLAIMM_02463 [Cladophialophora immunda]|nr:hypothetical protein CLAIMM_02463 [Cladophialophora immunda]